MERGLAMSTVREIVEQLQAAEEPKEWMEELRADSRAGVKAALNRWNRQYEKKEDSGGI